MPCKEIEIEMINIPGSAENNVKQDLVTLLNKYRECLAMNLNEQAHSANVPHTRKNIMCATHYTHHVRTQNTILITNTTNC